METTGLMYGVLFCLSSVGLSGLTQHSSRVFSSHAILLGCQTAASVVCAALASALGKRRGAKSRSKDAARASLSDLVLYAATLVLYAGIYVVSHLCRMRAHKLTNGATVLVARHLIPLVTALWEFGSDRDSLGPGSAASLLGLVAGVIIYNAGAEGRVQGWGAATWQAHAALAGHVVSSAAHAVGSQALLRRTEPGALVLRSHLAATALLGAVAAYERGGSGAGLAAALQSFYGQAARGRQLAALAGTMACAGCLNLSQTKVQAYLSSTSFLVLNNCLKVVMLAVSLLLDGKRSTSSLEWLGLLVTFSSGTMYSYLHRFVMKRRKPRNWKQEQGELQGRKKEQ